ncbi:DnaJ domain-containing protein [Porticoccus sp. W117]|uniref:J domain-containing protein n=1 Tax=Porticoccus sp. W117 TaxID=3054777 RepID=UPI002598CA6C|nr:DnaJ domain-containing protein [Porticoccus sp. W117]MDM3871100.1 DnaJ domain-containing protein [Porticoccus sp. W117]
MHRLLILIATLFAAWYWWSKFKACPDEKRKGFLLKSGFWGLLGILIVLAVTGRMHWIAVVFASLVPVVKALFGLALRVLPFLNLRRRPNTQQSTQAPPQQSNISEQEAWEVLGLQPGASKEEIVSAHKKLIQKLHPDRGGNDYLAARINQAKDKLLS